MQQKAGFWKTVNTRRFIVGASQVPSCLPFEDSLHHTQVCRFLLLLNIVSRSSCNSSACFACSRAFSVSSVNFRYSTFCFKEVLTVSRVTRCWTWCDTFLSNSKTKLDSTSYQAFFFASSGLKLRATNEKVFVFVLVGMLPPFHFWFQNRFRQGSDWLFVDGSSLACYNAFHPGKPNDLGISIRQYVT